MYNIINNNNKFNFDKIANSKFVTTFSKVDKVRVDREDDVSDASQSTNIPQTPIYSSVLFKLF